MGIRRKAAAVALAVAAADSAAAAPQAVVPAQEHSPVAAQAVRAGVTLGAPAVAAERRQSWAAVRDPAARVVQAAGEAPAGPDSMAAGAQEVQAVLALVEEVAAAP